MTGLPLDLILGTLARIAVVCGVLLLWLPRYIFPPLDGLPGGDRLLGGAAQMLLLVMVLGYVLVTAHIYEWLTVVGVIVVAVLARRTVARHQERRSHLGPGARLEATLLEEIDGIAALPAQLLSRTARAMRARWSGGHRRPDPLWIAGAVLVAGVGTVAGWIRLWGNFAHAALPLSDAYVVLAWIKEVSEQHLFVNGVYPEGFHIFAATVQKLGLANPVVVEKFIGPLVGCAMVASVGYLAYRVSGRPAAGVVAALIYGTLPALLPYDVARQAATDSQEFGNMLVLPIVWFTYRAWCQRSVPGYRVVAVVLLAAVALVHPLAAANAAAGAVAATLAAWLVHGIRRDTLRWMVRWVPRAALLAVLPLAAGLALGLKLQSTSASFLVSGSTAAPPPITALQTVALLAPVALYALRRAARRPLAEQGAPLAAAFTLAAALLIGQAPRFGLHSEVLASRSGEFIALAEAAGLGLAWALAEELLARVAGARRAAWMSLWGVAALATVAWIRLPPVPAWSYTMDADDFVKAYVLIQTQFTPTDWLAVSDGGGYALSFGYGFHLELSAFLAHVPPAPAWPTYNGQPIGEDHIFIFVEKSYHTVHIAGAGPIPSLAVRRENAAVAAWVAAWERLHGPMPVYFDGPDTVVYELSRPASGHQVAQRLFGG